MKTLFYLLLLVGLTSCTTYNVSSQSPSQYNSVNEQVIIEEPATVTYINYVPTFTFSSYYNYTHYWGWRRYYFAGYPMYLDTWNPYPRRWYWSYYAWNYHPYTWNYYNWNYSNWHYNNWYHNNWYNPNNCYSPFFSPVAQSNHRKLTNYKRIETNKQYTSIPSTTSRKPNRVPTYNKPQPVRNYQYTKPQQPVRQQYNRPQPIRQQYSRPQQPTRQSQPRLNINQNKR